jgi:membrane protein YqaA with SNARE-associated domain
LLSSLFEWTKVQVLSTGPWGLFILAFVESSFFLIPPDILLIVMVLANPEQAFFLASITTAGSVLGACFGYGLGRWGGRPLLERMVSSQRIQLIESYYQQYDVWAIGIAGFTPLPYKLFTVSGGAFRLNFSKFIGVSILSRGGRFFLVSTVLYLFGTQARVLIERYFSIFTILFIVCLIAGFWIVKHFSFVNARTPSEARGTKQSHP